MGAGRDDGRDALDVPARCGGGELANLAGRPSQENQGVRGGGRKLEPTRGRHRQARAVCDNGGHAAAAEREIDGPKTIRLVVLR